MVIQGICTPAFFSKISRNPSALLPIHCSYREDFVRFFFVFFVTSSYPLLSPLFAVWVFDFEA